MAQGAVSVVERRYLRSIDRTRCGGQNGVPRVVFRRSEGGWRPSTKLRAP
jgi:hypothetical protein